MVRDAPFLDAPADRLLAHLEKRRRAVYVEYFPAGPGLPLKGRDARPQFRQLGEQRCERLDCLHGLRHL
jgi:hypothetical protein